MESKFIKNLRTGGKVFHLYGTHVRLQAGSPIPLHTKTVRKGPKGSVPCQVTSQAMSPPGLLTPWAACPLAFQIMLTHLIKFSQWPQIKFKADGNPEGPCLTRHLPLAPSPDTRKLSYHCIPLVLWSLQAWNLTTN